MESWLQSLASLSDVTGRLQEVGVLPLLGLLLVSLLSALLMSALYTLFYEGRGTGTQLHRAFPLIGVSITAIFLAVQFSLPLSLGLLGALSIVRFRTPIKEPEEIGFILLVIATSLCVATFSLMFLGAVVFVAVVGLLILRFGPSPFARRGADGVLVVELSSDTYREHAAKIHGMLDDALNPDSLESIATREKCTVLTQGFKARDRTAALRLVDEIMELFEEANVSLYTGAVVS